MPKRCAPRGPWVLAGLLFLLPLIAIALDPRPLSIQSMESKTGSGGPIYNRISYWPGWKRDVWMMQQSHSGPNAKPADWDRIAIVIDHTLSPSQARFIQLAPGPLEPSVRGPARPFSKSCFACHSNGPRAIRPDVSSALSAWDRARLFVWNLRVASYGRILGDAAPEALQSPEPFRLASADDNQGLPATMCRHCHNDSPWGRGQLTRQNSATIRFMTERKFMPPPGFSVSESDERKIWRFVRGFMR